MEIQLSVIIWTVICFLLLMLILKKLLFTPILKMLDGREEKIEAARKKKAEIERLTAENEEYISKQKALYDEKRKKKFVDE